MRDFRLTYRQRDFADFRIDTERKFATTNNSEWLSNVDLTSKLPPSLPVYLGSFGGFGLSSVA